MPNPVIPTHFLVMEDGGAQTMARVLANDATNAQQADISSITYKVFDIDNSNTETATGTLTVSDVIFDTLQTDARWSVDTTGYNFRHEVPATAFPTGGNRYQIEYKCTPASGQVFWVVFGPRALAILTS